MSEFGKTTTLPDPQALRAENHRLKEVIKSTETSRNVLAKALEKEKKRSLLHLKLALIFGFPVLIFVAPLIFVFYLVPKHLPKYLKSRRLKRILLNILASEDSFFAQVKRAAYSPQTFIYDAYIAFHSEGLAAAKKILDTHSDGRPAGVADLFDAMDAQNDTDWQASMNRWCGANHLGALSLGEGERDRFHRICFDPLPVVNAPHLVSVIMPCFNASKTLEMAIKSILDQTWQNIELIAVNDASTDDTGTILETLARSDPRLRVFHNAVNVGPYVSKNRALRLSKGAYITGHDADDIALPDRIARQMAPILDNQDCKASLGYMIRMDAAGRFDTPGKTSGTLIQLDGVLRLAFISMLIERVTFDRYFGFWDSVRVAGDSELLERVTEALPHSIHIAKSCTMFCLTHPESLTQNVQSGLSFVQGHSLARSDYKNAFRAWHSATRPDQRRLDFPPQPRAFKAPEKMVVPLDDILLVLAQDEPLIQA
jgi:hypothetical protein